jgi:Fe-S cluster assembly ATP-binding protein
LQMKLIWPKYIILDEIDSGLDLDAFKIIAKMLCDLSNKENTLIIITHYFKILDFINIDKVYIIKEWKIVKNGDIKLVDKISDVWFNNI